MDLCFNGLEIIKMRDHCHRQRIEGVDVKARRKLIIASCLCLVFMICEIVGGVLSNSLAIATDAAHLLTDFASFMISLFAIWLAGRPSTQRMSFGWYRAEVIGALASVLMIWCITAILVWLAIQRVINQDFELDANVMLITSGLGILINIIMGVQLQHGHSHGGGHGHKHHGGHGHKHGGSHGHTHGDGHTCKCKKKHVKGCPLPTDGRKTDLGHHHADELTLQVENMNVRAAFIHVLGDVVQSVGVFIAALIIYLKPEWALADPICTFIFSIIVLITTFAIMKDALLVLMEGTPSYLDYMEILNIFGQIEGVKRAHNLRIWALSINKIALSVHLAVAEGADAKKILHQASTAVHKRYNFFETTIQIEDFTPAMESCSQCTVPNV